MQQALRRSSLVPTGFVVESAFYEADRILITVRAVRSFSLGPACGTVSRRVHSHYRRRVADLPLAGRSAQLVVIARRFRCEAVLCGRQIFTERFADGVLAPSARRTARLDCIVHHLGLALGGRPAANFAKRLMLPVSNDTLLRVVRRRVRPPSDPLRVIGIDDWAWRRNHRYASIICNLERRRVVTLLPDREPATAQAWFAGHPTIAIVARDRGGGYGEAAAKALPDAMQVADRWHLMENASRAFLDAVRKSMRQIRAACGATTINPKLLTAAERIQYEGYLRREETNTAILALSKNGTSIKQIVRQTGHSRKLVRQVVRGEHEDIFRTGGRRPWFRCAAYSKGQYCGRRVAVLYAAGDLFACRHCYGLGYASQQESPRSRLISRSRKIGMRLGGSPDLHSPFRKGRVECTSARTCAFERVTLCCRKPRSARFTKDLPDSTTARRGSGAFCQRA
jgi:transposase